MNLKSISQTLSTVLVGITLAVIVPTSQSAAIAADPSQILFNSGTCELAAAGYAGTGSQQDPYQISDSDSLWEIADCSVTNSQAANFKLIANIDATQAQHAPTASPIGLSTSGTVISFEGNLDGQDKDILNISMTSATHGVGLFAELSGGTISRLNISGQFSTSSNSNSIASGAGALAIWASETLSLSGVLIDGTVSGVNFVGGLVGASFRDLDIESVTNRSTVLGTNYVGGLVGWANSSSSLLGVINEGQILAATYAGGLIGYADAPSVVIEDSSNLGTVSASVSKAAGFVALITGSSQISVMDSHNFGDVSATGNIAAGILGDVSSNVSFDRVTNTGDVMGSTYVGGLIAWALEDATFLNIQNSGDITASNQHAGGLFGEVNGDLAISQATNSGIISASSFVGGLGGTVDNAATLTNVSNNQNVFGGYATGGFIGTVGGSIEVSNARNSGSIYGFSGDRVGGVVGNLRGAASSSNFVNAGAISGGGYLGGFAGYAIGPATISEVSNTAEISGSGVATSGVIGYVADSASLTRVSNTRNVSGVDGVAGLVALAGGQVELIQTLNTGAVSAAGNYAGGFIAEASGAVLIEDSLNSGDIDANNIAGGMVANVAAGVTITVTNSLQVGRVTDQNSNSDPLFRYGNVTITSSVVTSESRVLSASPVAELRTSSLFQGWDFTNVWGFGACQENNGFPMLRFANQVSTYYSNGCYTAPSPSQSEVDLPAPAPKLPRFDKLTRPSNPGSDLLLTGVNLDLISSAEIEGNRVSVSQLSSTSVVFGIPQLEPGVYSLVVMTEFGRVTYQDLIEIAEEEIEGATVTEAIISKVNSKSSWLTRAQLDQVESAILGKSTVTCIAYNDRPGVVARKKALSRAIHACSMAASRGIQTRVFVYGKAPQLADTVKILFR